MHAFLAFSAFQMTELLTLLYRSFRKVFSDRAEKRIYKFLNNICE